MLEMKSYLKKLILLSTFILTISTANAMSANSQNLFTSETQGDTPFSFSISTGVLNGESKELVYDGSYGRISELTWDLDNVPMIGIETSVKPSEKLSFNFSGWSKIKESGGNMEDYDWYLGDSEPWTDYSSHDTKLDEAYMLDANLDYIFCQNNNYAISGQLGFRHDRYKWNAYDAYGTYSNWGYNPDTEWDDFFRTGDITISGKAITYDQKFYTPYLGMTFNMKKEKWFVNSYFRGSLWAWAEGEDNHHDPGYTVVNAGNYYVSGGYPTTYVDEVDNIAYVSLGLSIGYMLKENLVVNLSGDFQRYIREKGDSTAYYSDGAVVEYDDGAGLSNYSYMVSLGATYLF